MDDLLKDFLDKNRDAYERQRTLAREVRKRATEMIHAADLMERAANMLLGADAPANEQPADVGSYILGYLEKNPKSDKEAIVEAVSKMPGVPESSQRPKAWRIKAGLAQLVRNGLAVRHKDDTYSKAK